MPLDFFKLACKPITQWAAREALVGRNRSRQHLEQGRFTQAEVTRFIDQAWHAFDSLVPDLSHEPTSGSRLNVRLAALTLAFLRSLTAAGIERDYAIELIGDTCWKVYQYWGRWGRFANRLLRKDPFKNHLERVGQDGSWAMTFPFNPPGYLARYAPVENGIGFDVVRCPVAEFFHAHGAPDLAVSTWCMLDYPLAEILDLELARSGTLAGGADRCAFQWRRA